MTLISLIKHFILIKIIKTSLYSSLNRWVFYLDLKVSKVTNILRSPGKLFHRTAAAMSNHRWPYDFVLTDRLVLRIVLLTIKCLGFGASVVQKYVNFHCWLKTYAQLYEECDNCINGWYWKVLKTITFIWEKLKQIHYYLDSMFPTCCSGSNQSWRIELFFRNVWQVSKVGFNTVIAEQYNMVWFKYWLQPFL